LRPSGYMPIAADWRTERLALGPACVRETPSVCENCGAVTGVVVNVSAESALSRFPVDALAGAAE